MLLLKVLQNEKTMNLVLSQVKAPLLVKIVNLVPILQIAMVGHV